MARKQYTKDGVGGVAAKNLPVEKEDKHFAMTPADLARYTTEEDEGINAQNTLIPRLTVLQGLSPQLDRHAPEYIEGAQLGQICDVALGEVWNEIRILPCYYADVYLEWAPRDSGEGLIRNYGTDSSAFDRLVPDEKQKRFLPNGNEIVQTGTIYCLNLSAAARPSFFPLSSTAYKSARQFNIRRAEDRLEVSPGVWRKVKMIYRTWNVTTDQRVKKTNKWYVPTFHRDIATLEFDPSGRLYERAQVFADQIKAGLVQADYAREADEESGSDKSDRL